MNTKRFLIAAFWALIPMLGIAQSVSIKVTYVDEKKNTVEAESDFAEQAPLDVTFFAVPQNIDDHTAAYEWHFRKEGETQDMMVRYEQDTQYTFVESGTYKITLKARLTDIEADLDSTSIKITVKDSKLEFPNAFSPNGDGENDTYHAKKDYRSIVEFHAYIYNRWGQKLHEWTDPAGCWDGTYKGKPVKEGVYFLLCKAKGADGYEYNIRKDVNLLRGYNESTSNSGK
jgi:gliding motility-associated-like protein